MPNDLFKKTALWTIKIGLFIVPFIPLYVSRVLFFPYITGKAFIFRTIIEIIFATWVFLAVFWPEYRPKKSALTLAVVFFVLAVILATIFAANPSRAFWSNFERMEGLLSYLHLAAYFLVLASVFTKREWFWFLNLFVLAGMAENFYALFQRLGYLASPQGGFRVDGTVGNPTYLAAYLAFVMFLSFYLWQNAKSALARWYYAAVSLFSLLMIYFTATRGAMVGLLGAGILAALCYLIFARDTSPQTRFYKKLFGGMLLVFLLLPSLLWYFRAAPALSRDAVLSRFLSISFTERTVASRFLIWKLSFEGFKERPLLGWGPENFNLVFAKNFDPGLYNQEPWFDRTHNIVFDWLITGGLIGFLAYFGIFASALWTLFKLWQKNIFALGSALLFGALFLAYLIQNFFVFDQLATYLSFFAVLAYLDSSSPQAPTGGRGASLKFPSRAYEPFLASLLLLAALISVYFLNFKPYLANKNLLAALEANSRGDFPQALGRFERALSLSPLGRQETRENFTRFAVITGQNANLPDDFRVKVFTRALEEAKASVDENSKDPRPYLFLSALYRAGNSGEELLSALKKAQALMPAKQVIYFEIADFYVAEGNFAKAAEELEAAFKLLPEFSEARVNLAAVYILQGRQEEADRLLMEGFGTVEYPREILIQVYYRQKNYERLVGIWKAFVRTEPQKLEHRRSLAGSYLLAGKRNEAIKTLEKAMEDFPGFKAEGEALIKDLSTGS